MYRVKLSDGTTYEGLRRNGTYYITDKRITEEDFRGKLRGVVVEYEPEETDARETEEGEKLIEQAWREEYDMMELVSILKLDGGWGFSLLEITGDERERIELRAQVEYTVMMTGTELA